MGAVTVGWKSQEKCHGKGKYIAEPWYFQSQLQMSKA